MDKHNCQPYLRQLIAEHMWIQTKIVRSSFAQNKVCLQQHGAQFNRYITICNCLSKDTPSSYRFSSQLPVGEKFSNSASTLAEQVLSVKEQVRSRLEKSNAMYKEAADKKRREKLFEKGDMVMLYLRKTRILAGAYNKLKPKSMGSSKS